MFLQNVIKNTRELVNLEKLTSTVTVKGSLLAKNVTNGKVIPATSSTVRSEIEGVSNQDIAAAEALSQVPAILVSSSDTWIADTTNNSNTAHNYQRMILTDAATVNNTGTDSSDGIVEQVGVFGVAADKKIIVRFL